MTSAIPAGLPADELVGVRGPVCIMCGIRGIIIMPVSVARAIQEARTVMVPEVLSTLTTDEREVLISGTHPQCWETLYGDGK